MNEEYWIAACSLCLPPLSLNNIGLVCSLILVAVWLFNSSRTYPFGRDDIDWIGPTEEIQARHRDIVQGHPQRQKDQSIWGEMI